MVLTIHLSPESTQRLESIAQDRGQTPEAIAAAMVEERLALAPINGDHEPTPFSARVGDLAAAAQDEAIRHGEPLLDADGVNREVAERRGGRYDDES